MRRLQNRTSSSDGRAVAAVGGYADIGTAVDPDADAHVAAHRTGRPGNGPGDADPLVDTADVRARAREVVLRRLSHAPRTRAQLLTSLRERDVPAEVAEAVLDELSEVGLIDDQVFARAWVEGRSHSRGLSRSRLRRELLDRGIDIDLAEDAVSGLDGETDEAAARALAQRWSQRRPLRSEADRGRLVGYLVRRGYGPGLAARIARDG